MIETTRRAESLGDRVIRQVCRKLAATLYKADPPPPGGFVNSLPEAFGARDADGEIFVIGYRGEWYFPLKPNLRTRVRNWLVSQENKRFYR